MRIRGKALPNRASIDEWLSYEPDTGIFRWRKRRGRVNAGDIAGRLANGYVMLKLHQVDFFAHRAAWCLMTGSWPTAQIDHKDQRRANNRWTNLREATNKQNHENLPVLRTNTSGIPGVRWDASRKKWYAFITHDRVMRNLGRFARLRDAVSARRKAEREMFTHSL